MSQPDTPSSGAARAAASLAGLWSAKVPSIQGEPPFLWRWPSVHAALLRARDEIGIELAERRVVKLVNPHLAIKSSSRSVQMNFQLVKPGEVAPAHRHTLAAIRFVIDGSGAYTNVEGDRCDMAPGDFILTPAWTWHDHFNGADRPIIWLDGLDGPLIQALNVALFEGYGDKSQVVRNTGGEYRVPWAAAAEVLQAIGAADEHPADGAVYRYPDLPTLACELVRPRMGSGAMHRRASVSMIHVVRGQGRTVLDGGDAIEWTKGDTFTVPAWRWHSHEAAVGGAGAIFFRMTDRPLLEALKLYREEIR